MVKVLDRKLLRDLLNLKSQDAPYLDNANVRRALMLGLNRNYVVSNL